MAVIHYKIRVQKYNFEQRKKLDKNFQSNVIGYTGMAGKSFCFDFANAVMRDLFLKILTDMLNKNKCDFYEFFATHGTIKKDI